MNVLPFFTKKIKVTKEGVYILDPEIHKKINKKTLSPRLVGAVLQSPADWVLNTFILDLCKREEKLALKRGCCFHEIMEQFFAFPEEDRDGEHLKQAFLTVINKEEYKNWVNENDNKQWLLKGLKSYGKSGAKPRNEKIANIFVLGKQQLGIELDISGKIGNVKRNCYGKIDKILEGEKGLIIQDWKTGTTVHDYEHFYDKTIKHNDLDFDYWRQQTAYAMLLENAGFTVESASLIFPFTENGVTIVNVEHKNNEVREQVKKDYKTADKILIECTENKYFFPFKKGKWNGWSSWLGNLGKAPKPDVLEDKFMEIAEIEEE